MKNCQVATIQYLLEKHIATVRAIGKARKSLCHIKPEIKQTECGIRFR